MPRVYLENLVLRNSANNVKINKIVRQTLQMAETTDYGKIKNKLERNNIISWKTLIWKFWGSCWQIEIGHRQTISMTETLIEFVTHLASLNVPEMGEQYSIKKICRKSVWRKCLKNFSAASTQDSRQLPNCGKSTIGLTAVMTLKNDLSRGKLMQLMDGLAIVCQWKFLDHFLSILFMFIFFSNL